MFATAARLLAGKAKPRLPRLFEPRDEHVGLADTIRGILRQHGPITIKDCWKHAEQEGVKSKRQMKIMLRWLKAREDCKVQCHHLTGDKGSSASKEFLFSLSTKKPGENASPRAHQEDSSPRLPL